MIIRAAEFLLSAPERKEWPPPGAPVGVAQAEALLDALDRFESTTFDPAKIRSHVEQFNEEHFAWIQVSSRFASAERPAAVVAEALITVQSTCLASEPA